MIEITKMYHKRTGEIVFQDVKGDWYEIQNFNSAVNVMPDGEWEPVVATKIEDPTLNKE